MLFAAFSGSIAFTTKAAGIVLSIALITVLLVSAMEELAGQGRARNYSVVAILEILGIVCLYIVGTPPIFEPFLQWLGFILIQVFVAVVVIETLNHYHDISRTTGYSIACVIISLLTLSVWLL